VKILHIDCSPRPEAWSRKLSSLILQRVLDRHNDATVRRLDLGIDPVPHTEPAYATALSNRANFMAAQGGTALDRSDELIEQLESADLVILGTPMNNFTIPSSLKAWLDQVIRMGRTMGSTPAGKVGLLSDRPVLIAVSSGDIFEGENANQPDFLRPYLTAAFSVMGLKSVQYFSLQATARQDDSELLQGIQAMESAIEAAVEKIDVSVAKVG
jgi:FMN-dependent NADH-azoreductase